jgi:aspartate/methionine/tyrosine aminotransferase
MNSARCQMGSPYIEWAKTQAHGRFNLATSGVSQYPIAELANSGDLRLEDIELSGPSWYGYEPLQRALAAKAGVPAECVVAANGTSMANHLVMAAALDPGDEVLIEEPAYDPLLHTARLLGARVRRFRRPFEEQFRVDPREIERAITPCTRLIVLTNPHNPSGAFTDEATLQRIGEIARGAHARVLVDEVYLEASFSNAARSAFHLGNQFVATGSLTKAYGLGGLRCGWILAEPDFARAIWRLNDLYGVIPAHPAERLSVIALQHLDRIRERARSLLEANRRLLDAFLDSQPDLQCLRPPFGTVVFPRLACGNADAFCQTLRERFETVVVPGRFFESPEHFRIGIGGDTATLAEGLRRMGTALQAQA